MQLIPGVFYKPCSVIPRCKSPQALAWLGVSQPLEQHSIQTDRRTHRQEDGEQWGQLCKDREWEVDCYLEKKVGAQKEEDSSERVGGR